jgi:hypothetical protein
MSTAYNGKLTRPHWGGATQTVDQHLEIYDGEVDTAFQYNALFRGLSTQRSTAGRSNTYRIDRLNRSQVKGRQSGVALDPTFVTSDKLQIIVDTVLYIRNPIDYQDDWTAPDFQREMGQNNGTAFAETWDQAHIIQLQKSRSWVAPAHLKPAFYDGLSIPVTIAATPTTQAQLEANATLLFQAHKKGVDALVKRKVPLNDMVTLVSVDIFSALLEHPKLLNKEIEGSDKNGDYNGRRLVRLNGIPVVECTEFPTAPITSHPLGTAFNVVAADVRCQMITFSKSQTLVTVEAQPFTSRIWDDKLNFANVLDCYAMYTVGQRRPDTCVVVDVTTA